MKTKKILGGLMSLLTAGFIFAHTPSTAEAEVFRGMAAIVNNDIIKAQREAQEDAMRNCIESNLGTRVQSDTEVSMGIIVSDRIVTNADGYIRVKGSPKFTQKDGIMIAEVDLEANAQTMIGEFDNIKGLIQNAMNADTTGRTHIVVAVSGRDENGRLQNNRETNIITTYVDDKMALQGFKTHATDDVVEYIAGKDFDDPIARAEARKQVRNMMAGDVNGILRGSLSTVKVQQAGGMWSATVSAVFQLVGIVSSETNSYTEYFTAVDPDRDMAIKKARERASATAAEEIAKRAAETLQGEMKGGVQHTRVAIEIEGIVDRTNQGEKVLAAIRSAHCRIIRSLYDKNKPTTLKVFVDATSAGSLDEIKQNIKTQLPGVLEDGDEDTDASGSAKIYLRYRG